MVYVCREISGSTDVLQVSEFSHKCRRFLTYPLTSSKTSLMDPRFAPAWIAFAHAFSFEGEHEHAVTASSTCARLYTGSHLPLMFVGMEHIILSNKQQAEDALVAAQHMCDGDPLLYNERGVMAFSNEECVFLSQQQCVLRLTGGAATKLRSNCLRTR